MDRKKELKYQYKQMKSPMGIFIVRSKSNNKCYIEATHNLRGSINRARFQLEAGNHPNRGLQQEWKELSKDNFVVETLEELKYDKDESKTDYSEELAILQFIWEEKLFKENVVFYKK